MASNPDRTARNLSDTATGMTLLSVTDATTVKIADANEDRILFEFHNLSNRTLMLKLYSATTDNDNTKGIPVPEGGVWRMPAGTIYTGEISVISSSNTKTYTYVEY